VRPANRTAGTARAGPVLRALWQNDRNQDTASDDLDRILVSAKVPLEPARSDWKDNPDDGSVKIIYRMSRN
jgi:hypothetical protein